MTVETTTNRAFGTGDGSITEFDFTFKYFNDTDIDVYLDDNTTPISPTLYSVVRNPSGDGGTVVFIDPVADDVRVTIARALGYTQTTRIPVRGELGRGTLENTYDKLTMLCQQLKDEVSRSLVLPVTFQNAQQLVLPEPEAGRALIWRDDLSGLDNSDVNLTTLLDDVTAQAVIATQQAVIAANQAASATGSVTLASEYANTARTHRDNARLWSSAGEDVPVDDGTNTGFSAYHWSRKAQGLSVPMTTKGDIFVRGASGNARQSVGTDGQVLVADSTSATGLAWGYGVPTGVPLPFWGGEAYVPAGFILAQGSIGSAASAATRRANADTINLYTLLWNSLTNAVAPVSGGRGVSAAADFAANKTLTLPPPNGRAFICKDNMGGVSANVVTSASEDGGNAIILCGTGGEETHVQALSELRRHKHNITRTANADSGSARFTPPSITEEVNDEGAGDPMNVMGPWMAVNVILKL